MENLDSLLKEQREKNWKAKDPGYFLIHQIRYKLVLQTVQKIANGKKLTILDVGCYPYHMGKILEELGHSVYGIASQHEPIKKPRVSVCNIEEEKLPYASNFFDLVIFSEILEHLPHSPVFPFKEIFRVTKNGGRLLISTPNVARLINRVKLFFGKSIMYPLEIFFENDGKGNSLYHRHNREYTMREVIDLLTGCSWRVMQADYVISYTPFRERMKKDSLLIFFGKLLNYLVALIIAPFRDTLLIVASKN